MACRIIDSVHGWPLACSVRGCARRLVRRDRALVCPAGHAHDVARSGYVNLLQPQDRRSRAPGDSKAGVQARSDLLAAGVGLGLLDAVDRLATTLKLREDAVVVDLGSGSGDALARLAENRPIAGIGIDLSTAAAEHAARRYPALTWVVANADRRLPLLDQSVDLVLSLHGRRNPGECARVLAPGGLVLVAVPAPDDLSELRAVVQGLAVGRDRGDAMLGEYQPLFTLVDRTRVHETLTLGRESLLNLLRSTYRGARFKTAGQVEALDRMMVTLSSEVFVWRTKSSPKPDSATAGW